MKGVIVVTSDFHIPRTRIIFEKRFLDVPVLFAASKTHLLEEELIQLKIKEKRALSRLHDTG
jgi:uncharacterized SAM-binding protein YcdF (DUF218 family)